MSQPAIISCPLCAREVPGNLMQKHHLKTRRKDKDATEEICRECHKSLHSLFGNNDIRNTSLGLGTLEGLLSNEDFAKALKHIRKIPPGSFMKVRESNQRGHRQCAT